MKKLTAIILSIVIALACAVTAAVSLERVKAGYVGVVYSSNGVEDRTLSAKWYFMSPMKH